jgi:hypothetical protein
MRQRIYQTLLGVAFFSLSQIALCQVVPNGGIELKALPRPQEIDRISVDPKLLELKDDIRFVPCVVNASFFGCWRPAPDSTGIDRLPPSTVVLAINQLRMDRSLRSIFVTLDGESLYVVDRGGLLDELRWYGPLNVDRTRKSCSESS